MPVFLADVLSTIFEFQIPSLTRPQLLQKRSINESSVSRSDTWEEQFLRMGQF